VRAGAALSRFVSFGLRARRGCWKALRCVL